MRDHLIAVVAAGVTVKVGYKTTFDGWISDYAIHHTHPVLIRVYKRKPFCCSLNGYKAKEFNTAERAVDHFLRTVYTPKNLALCLEGLEAHDLNGGKDLDDIPEAELKRLVKKYQKDLFIWDYPFAAKRSRK